VRNFTARGHMTAMKTGDLAFFYHTGDEKQVVGIVEVIGEAYTDPTDETGKFVCVDVKAVAPLAKPVTLAAIKANRELADMMLVQQPRLSVQPVSAEQWRTVCKMGGI
jgi:predicted RNA-binding protein with PUA-like domain